MDAAAKPGRQPEQRSVRPRSRQAPALGAPQDSVAMTPAPRP